MIHSLSFIAGAAALGVALASGDAPPPPHHGPPPEAFDACSGKSEGDACTVTFRDKSLEGKCLAPPKDAGESRLFCAPPLPPEPPPDHS